jgi:hypothetical protein
LNLGRFLTARNRNRAGPLRPVTGPVPSGLVNPGQCVRPGARPRRRTAAINWAGRPPGQQAQGDPGRRVTARERTAGNVKCWVWGGFRGRNRSEERALTDQLNTLQIVLEEYSRYHARQHEQPR